MVFKKSKIKISTETRVTLRVTVSTSIHHKGEHIYVGELDFDSPINMLGNSYINQRERGLPN
jgi:hypothetical protein